MNAYAKGWIDALALVCCALLIIGAAVCSVGCEERSVPPQGGGCDYDLIDVEPVGLALGCDCTDDDDCEHFGEAGLRGTCGPQDRCTIACSVDADCDDAEGATCGPLDVSSVPICVFGGDS